MIVLLLGPAPIISGAGLLLFGTEKCYQTPGKSVSSRSIITTFSSLSPAGDLGYCTIRNHGLAPVSERARAAAKLCLGTNLATSTLGRPVGDTRMQARLCHARLFSFSFGAARA